MTQADRQRVKVVRGALLCLPWPLAGCFSMEPRPDFDSALPQDRFLAIQRAGAEGDADAVDDLIRQLSDDDLLLRWAAHDALMDLTGRNHGFEPDGPELERRQAIDRWAAWYESGPVGADQPKTAAEERSDGAR